jgi:tetratricopeptide (TPR) repeat protein
MSGDGYDCFISYASPDLALAEALRARLVEAKFKVWFDKARLEAGCDWHKHIEAGCEASRIVLPILTPRWKLSEWTRYETYGHASVIPLIAEGEEPAVLPPPLRRWQAQRFNPLATDEAVWQALFAAIRAKLAEPVPERAPRILDLPHPANPFFTGRDADLVRIHEELHEAPVAALTQGRVRALAAMGGVGKTTLANEYARRFWRLYPQILWVDARVGLESGFALLFGKLFPDRADEDLKQEDKARLALAELSGKQDRLLVIDNVEDAESVRPWLPRDATTGCRTLITSRFSDFPAAAGIRSIPLYVLEPEPSRQFLLARTGRTADGAELVACDALAKTLGYLPLALEQAAAYIAAPGAGVGFAAYLRLHEAAAADLLARKALGSTDYPDAVITTWQTTVAKLSPESRAVLRLCAWYADTPIPRALVMQGAEEVFVLAAQFGPVTPPANPVAAELRLRDALVGLARYSMILDSNDDSFRIHGLVQTVERVHCNSDQRIATLLAACTLITRYGPQPAFDPKHFAVWNELFPHARALHKSGHELPPVQLPLELLTRLDEYSFGRGQFAQSAAYAQERLVRVEAEFGSDSDQVASDLLNYGESLRELGQLQAARDSFRRSVAIRRAAGPTSELATSLNYLGLTFREVEDKEAEAVYREALVICDSLGESESLTAIKLLNNLGSLLRAAGKFVDAEALLRRSVSMSERASGSESQSTIHTLSNLAGCLLEKGDIAAAEPIFRQSLELSKRAFGAEHPITLDRLGNLASCLRKKGDLSAAETLCRQWLEAQERLRGPDHPEVATCLMNLARCLEAKGDRAAAELLYRRALDVRERVLGAEHPHTLISANNLASCLQPPG